MACESKLKFKNSIINLTSSLLFREKHFLDHARDPFVLYSFLKQCHQNELPKIYGTALHIIILWNNIYRETSFFTQKVKAGFCNSGNAHFKAPASPYLFFPDFICGYITGTRMKKHLYNSQKNKCLQY